MIKLIKNNLKGIVVFSLIILVDNLNQHIKGKDIIDLTFNTLYWIFTLSWNLWLGKIINNIYLDENELPGWLVILITGNFLAICALDTLKEIIRAVLIP